MNLSQEDIKLLEKNKIIPEGCPLAQVEFFAKVCEKKKLDPFVRQIHMVERKEKRGEQWIKSYTIQAGIDGMRAIAQRNAKIVSYKRWVEKREDDLYGCCEIITEDRGLYKDELPFNEYKQTKSDGTLNSFWKKFPQTMIKKCAEESVLRMMTPEDLSGVYGDDEMLQADEDTKAIPVNPPTQIEALKESIPEPTEKINWSKLIKSCEAIKELNAIWVRMSEKEQEEHRETFNKIRLNIKDATKKETK